MMPRGSGGRPWPWFRARSPVRSAAGRVRGRPSRPPRGGAWFGRARGGFLVPPGPEAHRGPEDRQEYVIPRSGLLLSSCDYSTKGWHTEATADTYCTICRSPRRLNPKRPGSWIQDVDKKPRANLDSRPFPGAAQKPRILETRGARTGWGPVVWAPNSQRITDNNG